MMRFLHTPRWVGKKGGKRSKKGESGQGPTPFGVVVSPYPVRVYVTTAILAGEFGGSQNCDLPKYNTL